MPGDKRQHFVDLCGLKVLAIKSNKPASISLAKELGIDTQSMKLALKETESLAEIMQIFDGQQMVQQFVVGEYRIDLYFPEHALAVECNEHAHQCYDVTSEAARSALIEQQLGCKWIRFNPDCASFKLAAVANQIFRHIISQQ